MLAKGSHPLAYLLASGKQLNFKSFHCQLEDNTNVINLSHFIN